MTNYDDIDFSSLDAFADDEVITHSPVRDVRLPSGKVLRRVLKERYGRPSDE